MMGIPAMQRRRLSQTSRIEPGTILRRPVPLAHDPAFGDRGEYASLATDVGPANCLPGNECCGLLMVGPVSDHLSDHQGPSCSRRGRGITSNLNMRGCRKNYAYSRLRCCRSAALIFRVLGSLPGRHRFAPTEACVSGASVRTWSIFYGRFNLSMLF